MTMTTTVTTSEGWEVEVLDGVHLGVALWIAEALGAGVDYVQAEDVADLARRAVRARTPQTTMGSVWAAFDRQGGLYVWNSQYGWASYSYPTSINARRAMRDDMVRVCREIAQDAASDLYFAAHSKNVRESMDHKLAHAQRCSSNPWLVTIPQAVTA